MPKSNFNHFLNECDQFENIGIFNKNKSKLSFEQGTKSILNTHTNMFLNARNDSMATTAEKIVAATPPSIIELNSELAFPSLMSSSSLSTASTVSSSSSSSSSSSNAAPKKFKNFKDAIASVSSPKKQVKELKSLIMQPPVVKRPPPPLLVKKESEVIARMILAKNKNIADNVDEEDDEYDEDNKKHIQYNKTHYDDDGGSDY
jgi:hypothetical protein